MKAPTSPYAAAPVALVRGCRTGIRLSIPSGRGDFEQRPLGAAPHREGGPIVHVHPTGDREADQRWVDAEHAPDRRRIESARRRPVGDDPTAVHDHDAREEVGREGKVMEHGEDRRSVALVEVDEQLHDLDLMTDVEVRGRLVEDEDRGGLGERDGHEDQLSLAQRQPPGVTVGEATDADPFHGGLDGVVVHRARTVERRIVGQTPQGDDLADRHREWHLGELGDDRDRPGDRLAVTAEDRLALQCDAAIARFEDAREEPQQGRLAGAVRPDEGDPLARLERQAGVGHDRPVAMDDGEGVGRQDRGHSS